MNSPHPATPHPPVWRIVTAYACVFVFWGSTYLAIRIGVAVLPPALLAGTRFLVASSVLLVAGTLKGGRWPRWKDWATLSIAGLFLFVGGNGLVVWSEQWVPSGLSALIIATTPLFMSSIDALVPGGHRLPAFGWAGIAVGFVGVAFLVSPAGAADSVEVAHAGAVVGLIGASFFWSIGSIYSKRHPVDGHLILCVGIEMLVGGVLLTSLGLATGEASQVSFTWKGALAVLYLAAFGSIVGFTAYTYLLRHVPAAKASTYAYVNPVVAVILGALILSEPFDLRTGLATVVILGGVGLVQAAQGRKTAPAGE